MGFRLAVYTTDAVTYLSLLEASPFPCPDHTPFLVWMLLTVSISLLLWPSIFRRILPLVSQPEALMLFLQATSEHYAA